MLRNDVLPDCAFFWDELTSGNLNSRYAVSSTEEQDLG